MSETTTYKAFRHHIYKFGDRITRVENLVSVGNPDVNCCIEGTESWIEIKSPIEPKRERTRLFSSNHELTVGQINFFIEQEQAGGNGFVLIASDKRWILISATTNNVKRINDLTVSEIVSISCWHKLMPILHADWLALRHAIICGSR